MNRSQFFKKIIQPVGINLLEPYTNALTLQEVLHLLRRTTFATDWKTVNSLVGKKADVIVELLLNNALKNPKPQAPTWINDTVKNPWKLPAAEQQKASDVVYKKLYDENYELKRWWTNAMATDVLSIREKMTLFWHGHFTTKFGIDDIMMAQMIYRQNDLLRTNHQGNFRKLAESITLDNAMLLFLNGNGSTKKSPNENFSRELLELYAIGIGNYTEKDVQEGARALTGWRSSVFSDDANTNGMYQPYFVPNDHDTASKFYLGETIPAATINDEQNVKKNEVNLLIDIILRKKGKEVANFICEKLFKYFVYSNPLAVDKTIVSELATTFQSNNFEIRPVLKQLFTSKYFFDKSLIGVQIKTPSETIVGITKHFDVKPDWKSWVMDTMGQELFNPPNVAGWVGYRKWVDTRTFPFGVQQIGSFMWNQTDDYMLQWIKQFDNTEDPRKLTEQMLTMFLAKIPTESIITRYTKLLLNNAPDYEWLAMLKNKETAGWRLKVFFIEISKNPNFHLA